MAAPARGGSTYLILLIFGKALVLWVGGHQQEAYLHFYQTSDLTLSDNSFFSMYPLHFSTTVLLSDIKRRCPLYRQRKVNRQLLSVTSSCTLEWSTSAIDIVPVYSRGSLFLQEFNLQVSRGLTY